MIKIDGSYLEGGGAIVRVASGLSVLTQQPLRIYNIRKGRDQPGLKTQHLMGLKTLADLCSAELTGATLGSTEIRFFPKKITKQSLNVTVTTAGSIGLLLQPIQLACILAINRVTIRVNGGATFGAWAPPIPSLEQTTFKQLEKMGYKIDLKIKRHGFYPKGGAAISASFNPPKELKPLVLEKQGDIESIKGLSLSSTHLTKSKVADRQADAAEKRIKEMLKTNADIDVLYVDASCPGSGICLWLKTNTGAIIGGDAIGERKIKAEKVGEKAADALITAYKAGATVDRYQLDQLIPFIALAKEGSIIKGPELTMHAKTNIWLTEQFLPVKFTVKNGTVRCSKAQTK